MSDPAEPSKAKYSRVLLKMSGEAFGHGGQSGISIDETLRIARQIKRIAEGGVQVAVVVGGGNILAERNSPPRARSSTNQPPTTWGCWPR